MMNTKPVESSIGRRGRRRRAFFRSAALFLAAGGAFLAVGLAPSKPLKAGDAQNAVRRPAATADSASHSQLSSPSSLRAAKGGSSSVAAARPSAAPAAAGNSSPAAPARLSAPAGIASGEEARELARSAPASFAETGWAFVLPRAYGSDAINTRISDYQSCKIDNSTLGDTEGYCQFLKSDGEAWRCTTEAKDFFALKKDADPADKTKKKEAFDKCTAKHGKSGEDSQCEEAAKELKDLRKEFADACNSLGGSSACLKTVRSCEECDMDPSNSDLNCVALREKAFCPELSADLLEDLEKESEDYKEKAQSLEDKITEKKEEKARLEGELTEARLEYEANIQQLKAEEEGEKEALEAGLQKAKSQIDSRMQAAIAKAQESMGKARELQYKLSLAILGAQRKYRDKKQEIYSGCQTESAQKLKDYRQARRAAIRAGQFKKESIYQMLSANRASFAQKDDTRFVRYYNSCRRRARFALKAAKENLQDSLKDIEFQKQTVIRKYKGLQGQLAALNRSAYAQEQAVIKDYGAALEKAVGKHRASFQAETRAYAQKGQAVNKQLMETAMEIMKAEGVLQETRSKRGHNNEMRHRLRSKGGSDEDKSSDIAEASGKIEMLKEEWQLAYEKCDCEEPGEEEESAAGAAGTASTASPTPSPDPPPECKRIRSAGRLVGQDTEDIDEDSSSSSSSGGGSG